MIVIDASAVFDLAIASPVGNEISDRLAAQDATLVAPELVDLEILQTMRRYVRAGKFDTVRARLALQNFDDLSIMRFSHAPLQARIWSLRDNLTAYDAAYVALAELLEAPLWTRDEKYRSVPGHGIAIEVL